MSKVVVTFGEIMGRLATQGNIRLRQSRQLNMTYAGAEANVAASICNFGGRARFVTALPKHALADATLDAIRAVGIETEFVVRTDEGRLGLYFLETGANQRPSNVIYDRKRSSVAITPAARYPWDKIFDQADWLHLSGITPALSETAAEATHVAARQAKTMGLAVSLDLNFRNKLWDWDASRSSRELARDTLQGILPLVDVLIANEEDCHDVLGIRAGETDVQSGTLDTSRYPDVARRVVQQFPNVRQVAITLRESLSASHNNWGAMFYDAQLDQPFFAPLDSHGSYRAFQIRNIVDRVGGGDAFAGGLIFALTTAELNRPQSAVNYAVAASCLKHSIQGDFNFSTRAEVESLVNGAESGRVVR